MIVQTMVDRYDWALVGPTKPYVRYNWALVGPTKPYVTINCPSSDADVKSELDVQALVSLPFYSNKLSRMVVSTTYDTQVNLTHVT